MEGSHANTMPPDVAQAVSHHALHHHFADLDQQRESATLGMWVFLLTEIMFFGGMLTAYLAYRVSYPATFREGSVHMLFMAGTLNTAILICSSLFVALAVHAAQTGHRKTLTWCLIAALFLGVVFLAIKGYEYHDHWVDHKVPGPTFEWNGPDGKPLPDARQAEIFFSLYFALTGFHALHMIIGIGLVGFVTYYAWKGHYTPAYHNPVENVGLYWHFVDIIWIWLYPLLYLIGHKHV